MSRRSEPTLGGVLVALLHFGFLLAASQDWLGARGLYEARTRWVGDQIGDSVRDATEQQEEEQRRERERARETPTATAERVCMSRKGSSRGPSESGDSGQHPRASGPYCRQG